MSYPFPNFIKDINKIKVPKDKVYDAIKNGMKKAKREKEAKNILERS